MAEQKQASQAKDLIFKELIKRGYALEGKTRVWNIADSKLWYLTLEQLRKFEDLKEERNFQKDDSLAWSLIESHVNEIIDRIDSNSFNFVDLGGAGKNIVSLLVKFKEKGLKINYYSLDLNELMLDRAKKLFDSAGLENSGIKFIALKGDFFNLTNILKGIKVKGYKKSILFLGRSTFVNFEPNEILFEVKQALKKSDLFILTSSLFSKSWIKRVKEYKENGKLDLWLFETIRHLGILREDVKFLGRFKEKRSEILYEFLKEKKLTNGNKEVTFYKGDKILVLFSYKHQEDDLLTYLNINFSEVSSFNSKDKIYKLALCKK